MQLLNHSPHATGLFVDLDRDGAETLVLVAKATFELGPGGEVRPAPMQQRILMEDQHAGQPGHSSVLVESDANWGRQGTDVIVLAHAYPTRRGERETQVALRVGPLAKRARVLGDRRWQRSLGLCRIGDPEPFERMPLIYERAFGGMDDSGAQDGQAVEVEWRNPVGMGFRARRSRRPVEGSSLPNIEDPQRPMQSIDDRPEPMGFTCIAKGWKPRSDRAGTYDEGWQRSRMPLLPTDFDPRFHQAASSGLHAASGLQGGEPVELVNLTPSRLVHLQLPKVDVRGSFLVDASVREVPMRLDVLVIDAVHSRLVLVWHGWHGIFGLVDDVVWARVEAEAR